MNGKILAGSLALMPIGLALEWPASASAQTTSTTQQANPVVIGDITVTAERRTQTAQSVAASITALQGSTLRDQVNSRLQDALRDVPNVRISDQGQFADQFFIRGVGDNAPVSITDSPVAVNIDGVFTEVPEAFSAAAYDVARVEVLRGPQGTLYGRNATAGSVNVITNDPTTGRFYGSATFGIGNYSEIRSEAMVNIPINDKLAARVSLGTDYDSGYYTNGGGDANTKSARAKLLVEPAADIKIVPSIDGTTLGGEGWVGVVTPIGSHDHNPWYSSDPSNGHVDGYIVNVRAPLEWRLGYGTINWLPAYDKYSENLLSRAGGADNYNDTDERQTSQELRLNSAPNSPITWVGGVYYLYFNSTGHSLNLVSQLASLAPEAASHSLAEFGQMTVPLVQNLRLTAGLRYTSDFMIDATQNLLRGIPTAPVDRGQARFSKLNYKLSLEWQLAPQSLGYATVASGYKAGGFYSDGSAVLRPFLPEVLTSYEIGIKNRFLNNRLQFNLDGFYYDYQNMQLPYAQPTATGPAIFVLNAQGVRVSGLELESSYLATPVDKFSLAVDPLQTRFGEVAATRKYDGFPLANSPKWSASASYQHVFELASGAAITAAADTNLTTGYWVRFTESPAALSYQKGYSRSDVTLAYRDPDDVWSVTAYLKNLENRAVVTGIVPQGVFITTLAPPRTYGASVTVKF